MKRILTVTVGLTTLVAGTLCLTNVQASTASPLLQKAIVNTDTAKYYRETDMLRTSAGGVSVSQTSTEQYDQKNNRESDTASFVISRPGKATQRYSVAIIMMNNHTYYRSTLNHAGWKVQAGYGYADANSGQRWVRAPLSFASYARVPISAQGTAPDGTYHVQFRAHSSPTVKLTGHADIWISTHGAPYIVHFGEQLTAISKGKTASQVQDTRLSNFNQPVAISAPKLGT
jgi:hypothetical protein